jgi:hypothetical protein
MGKVGLCWVLWIWVAVLQRGEGRVWLAVLFENGTNQTFIYDEYCCGYDEYCCGAASQMRWFMSWCGINLRADVG